jgi:hypothetical protein
LLMGASQDLPGYLFPQDPHPGPLPLAREREKGRPLFARTGGGHSRTVLHATLNFRGLFLLPEGEG